MSITAYTLMKKIKNIWLRIWATQKAKDTELPKLYHRISDLMLDKYITAKCDNDLSVLIISGNPSESELQQCWESIEEQYSEAIGGSQGKARLNEVKDYLELQIRIDRGLSLIRTISGGFVGDSLLQDLISFGYPLPRYNGDNMDTILKSFEGYLKRQMIDLRQMHKQLTDGKGKTELKRSDYYDMITAIAEYMGVVLKESDTSTALYCAMVVRYNKKIENEINKTIKNESL